MSLWESSHFMTSLFLTFYPCFKHPNAHEKFNRVLRVEKCIKKCIKSYTIETCDFATCGIIKRLNLSVKTQTEFWHFFWNVEKCIKKCIKSYTIVTCGIIKRLNLSAKTQTEFWIRLSQDRARIRLRLSSFSSASCFFRLHCSFFHRHRIVEKT